MVHGTSLMTVKKISQPPSILDIEASGFGSHSYPIEVGVKRADGERFCRLIKPFPSWKHWDKNAEALHGISRSQLNEYGIEGAEVCRQLNHFLGFQTAYSDGWVVDNPWLIKLYAVSKMTMTFRLTALEYLLSEYQMDNWHSVKESIMQGQSSTRHRASVDAELIQNVYFKTWLAEKKYC